MSPQQSSPEIIRIDIRQAEALPDAGKLHLYVVPLTERIKDETGLIASLGKEEELRASRFINPAHGQQYRCVRGLLRKLLAQYLDIEPPQVEFDYAEHGKPYLRNEPTLHFNLSHSRDMAVFAFCLAHEVGVDIEFMRPQKDLVGMIRHVGSPQEQTELQGLSEVDAYQAFYRLWTRKEAYIKAVGRGLGMGLRSIHIGTHVADWPLSVEYKNKIQPDCLISDIQPPENYKLAICTCL